MFPVPFLPEQDVVPRFISVAPLPNAPEIVIDRITTGGGIANDVARTANRQGRMLWIDATANIDRYNSEFKIAYLVRKAASSGFNTLVLDIKPISGQVIYRSSLAPRLLEWRGKKLDPEFDVLRALLRHAKPAGLSVLVSLNAFSEGHRLVKVGPGYDLPDQQTVIYDPKPMVTAGVGPGVPLSLVRDKVAPDSVSIFTGPEKVPATPGLTTVVLNSKLQVVADSPTAPLAKGNIIAVGAGRGATFLAENALPGESLSFSTAANFVRMADWSGTQIPLMMNPNHPTARKFALDVLSEVVNRYPIDGVLYDDRLRYAGMNADFSEITRRAFQSYIGEEVRWPDDAFRYTISPDLRRGIRPGRFYDQWMAWRAGVLKNFIVDARKVVKTARPGAAFGTYVGSWYGEYPANGHNYAAPEVEAPFWFLSPNYRATGTAPLLDLLITGCYYQTATIFEAMTNGTETGSTVEASATLTNRLARDQAWTYAGLSLIDFKGKPDGLLNAIQAAVASTQGVMVFDLSHDIEPMWPVFARAFSTPILPPHAEPKLLVKVRKLRKAKDKSGPADLVIPLMAGSPGTGQ